MLLMEQAKQARIECYETFAFDHGAYVLHIAAFFELMADKSAASKITLEQFNACERGRAAKRYIDWAATHGGPCREPERLRATVPST